MIFKKDVFTIPNLLSLLRLALVPLYATIYLNSITPADYLIAAGILAISCLTDLADGIIARRFGMVSMLGKFLDPLADKITQLTAILCLATRYPLIRSIIPLFLTKELLQSFLAYIHFRKGKILSGALWAGKICTTVLFISLFLLMVSPALNFSFVKYLILIDILFLIFALVSYLAVYLGNSSKLCDP